MHTEGRQRRLHVRTGIVALAVAALTAGGVLAATNAPAASNAAHSSKAAFPSISKQYFGNTTEPYTGLSGAEPIK